MSANRFSRHHAASELMRRHSFLQAMLIEQFASSGEAEAFPYLNESEFEGIYGLYAQPDKRVLTGGTVPEEDFPKNYACISKDELGFVNPEAFAGATSLYFEDYVLVPTKIAEFSSPLEAQSLCASICENSPLCNAGFQMDENSSPSLGLTYGCVSSCSIKSLKFSHTKTRHI